MVMCAQAASLVRTPTLLLNTGTRTNNSNSKAILRSKTRSGIVIIRTTSSNIKIDTILYVLLLVLVVLLSSGVIVVQSSPESNAQTLLKFKSSLVNANEVLANWRPSTNPCPSGEPGWNGVLCSDGGNIWGLQLENLGLSGQIDVESLVALPLLRTLSFMNNQFVGPMPDFRKLGALKSLYLSDNKFSGPIADDALEGMASLKKVHMGNNQFTGNIPTSMASSPRLLELKLENNQFVGRIPDFPPGLKVFNVSNNKLEGPIPPSVKNMNPNSFSGNKDLCGPPLDIVCNVPTSPPPAGDVDDISQNPPAPPPTSVPENNANPKKSSSSTLRVAAIVIACLVALAAIAVIYIVYHRRSSRGYTPQLGRTMSSSKSTNYSQKHYKMAVAAAVDTSTVSAAGAAVVAPALMRKAEQHGRLSFVREDRQRFELQDLLRASAEVLGSGSFGSSYKAVLMDGQAVVVKRFKQMSNVGREEFHEHMRRLGRLNHPNLLPLIAYYYRKEEKLLVFDYVHHGSLASQLHGKHNVDKPGLDWPTRLKIIKGVAKGLSYLYTELPSLIVPHGHLKSSNVLLDKSYKPLLMDYTLIPVVNLEQAHQLLVAYKSPEYTQNGCTTKKMDVWSLGILILELLTGQLPANYIVAHQVAAGKGDLASWMNSIVDAASNKVSSGTEIFDKEMEATSNAQGEMTKLLKIGVDCCEEDLEIRLDLKEAVGKIELLKERDGDAEVVNV